MLDRERIATAHRDELERFSRDHPRSRELFGRARGSLLGRHVPASGAR